MDKVVAADVNANVVCIAAAAEEHKVTDLKTVTGDGSAVILHLVIGGAL